MIPEPSTATFLIFRERSAASLLDALTVGAAGADVFDIGEGF